MGFFNSYEMMKIIARNAINRQEVKPEDYEDEKKRLVCGVCGEFRREYREFPTPTPNEPDKKSWILITKQCKCDRDKQEWEERQKQAEDDMKRIQLLRKASLMDKKFQEAVFEQFNTTEYNSKNLSLCKRYATNFDKMLENNQGLFLWGNVGTGKSFAAACIANYLLSNKISVIMTSFVKILEIIQNAGERENEMIERLNSVKLVIFDDLGAERNTDYALEKVYNIIDTRYRKNLPMILTSNLSMEDMKDETDIRYKRIFDRIFEVCYPIQFTGPSMRRKLAFERFGEMEKLLNEE